VRKAWSLLTNRVILGMLLFLILMAAWEFRIQPEYFARPMEDQVTQK
jgi:hypothetical protein